MFVFRQDRAAAVIDRTLRFLVAILGEVDDVTFIGHGAVVREDKMRPALFAVNAPLGPALSAPTGSSRPEADAWLCNLATLRLLSPIHAASRSLSAFGFVAVQLLVKPRGEIETHKSCSRIELAALRNLDAPVRAVERAIGRASPRTVWVPAEMRGELVHAKCRAKCTPVGGSPTAVRVIERSHA